MTPDGELLRRYAETRSEESFAELVRRHLDLVYSAALRQVNGDAHLAQDVAQTVFTDLASKATQLARREVLTGWLYTSTHFAAAKATRTEGRRRAREQEAHTMRELLQEPASEVDWDQLHFVLDEAMHKLKDSDREAILLRYFEKRPLAEIGAKLGVNENTARMRVDRALEKLRSSLTRRGVTTTAAALSTAITVNAVQVAPVGLAATLTSASLATAAAGTATTLTVLKIMAMTTMQKAFITATIVAAIGTGFYEARQSSRLRDQLQSFKQQQLSLAEQIQQLQRERDDATNSLASLADEIAKNKSDSSELLKLRSELTRLRGDSAKSKVADANNPMLTEMKSWLARVDQVKQRFEQTPNSKIPELQFLTEQDWLDATKMNSLSSDEDYQKAMAGLRMEGATRFGMVLQAAVSKFAHANNGQFPTDLSQLQPYLKPSVDSAILQRYQIMPGIYLGNDAEAIGDWAITQNAALDDRDDLRIAIGVGCIVQGYRVETDRALDSAINAFAAANNGRMPRKIYDLQPYITTPAEQAAFQKRIKLDLNNLPPNAGPIIDDAFPSRYR